MGIFGDIIFGVLGSEQAGLTVSIKIVLVIVAIFNSHL